ncbi:TetR/AcrR family transcriptional regulator [Saccharopolyspora sp. K220]|uniref:TetR/AcrR family transcriptional regulator C-terminal domain-containing protein n=1 Tax=Saccharopolyspora soli TaxID=2926618 RepID=UPI001F5AA63F|nr:TetR/AcrR family transcriptional regulator C-terminal domain-containing protein [Saccharopolyspora soli]MCI2417278.1 TetR/AcrR family transcriptional regulator [Saccharopolyspora soli]
MATEYSGGGDPARSLALLWRTQDGPSSGRRGRSDLGVDRIVRAGIDIADADGLAALSMRRVADHLGVGTMSLYTYVPGKAELIDVMLDTVYGETARAVDDDADWRSRLTRIARENWALYHRHPWMLQVAAGRAVLGPNAIAKYDHELGAVADLGLTEIEMDSLLSLVLGHAEAAARRAVEMAQVEQRSGMTDEQWWRAHAPLLGQFLDPQRYPTAARVGSAAGQAHGSAHNPAHTFEFGLQRILDGIEAFVATRSTDG